MQQSRSEPALETVPVRRTCLPKLNTPRPPRPRLARAGKNREEEERREKLPKAADSMLCVFLLSTLNFDLARVVTFALEYMRVSSLIYTLS